MTTPAGGWRSRILAAIFCMMQFFFGTCKLVDLMTVCPVWPYDCNHLMSDLAKDESNKNCRVAVLSLVLFLRVFVDVSLVEVSTTYLCQFVGQLSTTGEKEEGKRAGCCTKIEGPGPQRLVHGCYEAPLFLVPKKTPRPSMKINGSFNWMMNQIFRKWLEITISIHL